MAPVRVTCALIEHNDQVLIAKRGNGKALAGKWEFPGGKIDHGESPESCLVREIREELGCDIEIRSELSPTNHQYDEAAIELLPFICELTCGVPIALEHAEIQWIDPDALTERDLADADKPIAREYIELRNLTNG